MTRSSPSEQARTSAEARGARSANAPLLAGHTARVARRVPAAHGDGADPAASRALLTKLGWSKMTHATHVNGGALFEVTIDRELGAKQPRRLSQRELAVLELCAGGWSSKEIGTMLSISPETSRGTPSRVNGKLGLESAGLVPIFWAALQSPATRAVSRAGWERLVFEHEVAQPSVVGLSRWESELVLALVLGKSNQELSLQRQVAIRTIANQLHALFRKLRVTSRGELAALMLGLRPRTR